MLRVLILNSIGYPRKSHICRAKILISGIAVCIPGKAPFGSKRIQISAIRCRNTLPSGNADLQSSDGIYITDVARWVELPFGTIRYQRYVDIIVSALRRFCIILLREDYSRRLNNVRNRKRCIFTFVIEKTHYTN